MATQSHDPQAVRLPTTAVSRDVTAALDYLSSVTGLSKTFLIRSMLTADLAALGLLTPSEVTPTARKSQTRRSNNT